MNIFESSRHLGALRAVELSCFQRLGERAPWLEPPACATWAASASLAHAWRASVLEDLLPVSVGLPGLKELTVLPGGALCDELAELLPETVAAPRSLVSDGRSLVAGLSGRLYPMLVAEYADHLDRCSPASGTPTVLVLRRILGDLAVVQAEGDHLVSKGRA